MEKLEKNTEILRLRCTVRGVICLICAVHALLEVEKMSSGIGGNPVVRRHEVQRAVSQVGFSPVHLPFFQLYTRFLLLFLLP